VRVVAGSLGGRLFASPRSQRTHPMSDKVRGALFNTLGDIDGLTFLDAFSGSGALAYEALSRGATSVLMIENDRPAQQTIDDNITALHLSGQANLVKANCSAWSDRNIDKQFDVVLADPPFDHLQESAIRKLARHVESGGLMVLNWPGAGEPPELDGCVQVEQKSYGDTQLIFYRQD
jgi:16S rRNA (guanine966-N2)-methyltransferase